MPLLFAMIALLALIPALASIPAPTPAQALTDPPCGTTLFGLNTLTAQKTCPAGGYTLASGSTLDCQGFLLQGPNPPPPSCNPVVPGCITGNYGLRLAGVSGVTIKNCKVSQFERGLYLTDSSSNLIQDNTFRFNTRYGAQVSGASSGNTFLRNGYKNNSDEGVHFSDLTAGANTSESETASTNVAEGFYLLAANGLLLQNCFTLDNGAPGIYVKNSAGVVITNCSLTNDNIQVLNDLGLPWIIQKLKTAP